MSKRVIPNWEKLKEAIQRELYYAVYGISPNSEDIIELIEKYTESKSKANRSRK